MPSLPLDDARAAVPARLNLALLVGCIVVTVSCLYLASHGGSLALRIGAAIAFSFINNTMFSLMHEAVHGVFHPNATINEAAGRIAAAFFPTAFSLQRAFHLAHHRNNRSDCERFDLYGPDENRFLKFAQWYCILTGLYWIASPVFCGHLRGDRRAGALDQAAGARQSSWPPDQRRAVPREPARRVADVGAHRRRDQRLRSRLR